MHNTLGQNQTHLSDSLAEKEGKSNEMHSHGTVTKTEPVNMNPTGPGKPGETSEFYKINLKMIVHWPFQRLAWLLALERPLQHGEDRRRHHVSQSSQCKSCIGGWC